MSDGAKSVSVPAITAEAARAVVTSATERANEIGVPMCIAVTDPGGELKAFLRMDNAPALSVSIAQDKAYTSVGFGMSTDAWWNFIKDDPPLLHGIVKTPRLIVFGGGFPIKENDQIIGGIGVSGGHYTQDSDVAGSAIERNGLTAG